MTNNPENGILITERERTQEKRYRTMTKNINARYNFGTGVWVIRNNGKVIAGGNGLPAYLEAVKKVKETTTKKIVEKMLW